MATLAIIGRTGITMTRGWMLFILYSLLLGPLVNSQTFPSADTVKSWSVRLDTAFKKISSGDGDLTGAETFTKKLQNDFGRNKIVPAKGQDIVESVSSEVAGTFDYNIKALKNLVSNIEALVKNYKYQDEMGLEDLTNYLNMAKTQDTETAGDFKYDPKFKQDVNYNQSGVHIPLEIYEGYPDIINGLEWSGKLESIFKENYAKYPGIYWQSFGSQTGFLRVYPSARWQSSSERPDLFDVRRRPWYIHGSVTPKDMIILLDTSGSMHGQSFDIMKLAAKMLINTLGEDDYFNVASFDRNVSWVTPCLDTLVQANSRNKRFVFDGIDKLKARYIASYTDGLNFAYNSFDTFDRVKQQEEGSECHKLIMVFSDGGTVYPEEVIDFYGNQSLTENVRIFSYAVGPHPLPTVALKTMACRTGGAFTTITAMGAIRTKVQDSYLNVIARPQVLKNFHTLQFTSVYADALGLGLITTVTFPVFNTSEGSDNQTLAGVVGIDIPVNNLEALIPRRQLGSLGYGFALNQNGFLVFHPNLWSFMNYFEDPSHVDFADVVGETEALNKVRKDMIDGKSGSSTIEVDHEVFEFSYSHVPDSSFSIGIVHPKDWNYIKPEPQEIKILSSLLSKREDVGIAPWIYCHRKEFMKKQGLPWLLKQINGGNCEPLDALYHLAWDVKNVLPVFDSIKSQRLSPEDFPSRFVLTEGGFSLHTDESPHFSTDPYNSTLYKIMTKTSRSHFDKPYLYLEKNKRHDRILPKYKIDQDDEFVLNDVIEIVTRPDLLREAPSQREEARLARLHLVKPFFVEDGGRSAMAGISGIELSYSYLESLFLESTHEIKENEYNCFNNTELRCEILDNSGSILYSNRDDVSLGDFLGSVDPNLMKHMVEKSRIFVDENPVINYQALCPDSFECTASGVRLGPSLEHLLGMWSAFIGAFQTLQIVITSFLSTLSLFPDEVLGLASFQHRVKEGIHRCTTTTSVWTLNSSLKKDEFHDRMTSSCRSETECKRDLHIYLLKNINGIFVVSNPECAHCNAPPFPDGPVEIMATENCLLPHRYRKRQPGCFAQSDMETSECSRGSITSPGRTGTLSFMLASCLLPLLLRKLL